MHAKLALAAALSGFALVNAQNPPAPTPSNAVVIEGDESYDGPVVKGTTGKLGDAQVVIGNPGATVYKATLPPSTVSGVRGYVLAQAGSGGKGIDFKVYFSGLPDPSTGPFSKSSLRMLIQNSSCG